MALTEGDEAYVEPTELSVALSPVDTGVRETVVETQRLKSQSEKELDFGTQKRAGVLSNVMLAGAAVLASVVLSVVALKGGMRASGRTVIKTMPPAMQCLTPTSRSGSCRGGPSALL
jgi:hypothetical protein